MEYLQFEAAEVAATAGGIDRRGDAFVAGAEVACGGGVLPLAPAREIRRWSSRSWESADHVGEQFAVDLLGRGVHGARSIVVADAAAQILRRCVFGPAPHDSIAHSWHRGVSSRHYTISLKAVTCKDIGGRGGDRTHDRWCVNAFDQHLWRLSVPILYPYVQLSGVLSSNPSTDTQAVRARLGTLLAQTGVWSTCARLPKRTQTFSHGWTGHYLRGSARHRPPGLTSSRHGTSTGMIICARSVSGALRRWSRWKL